MRLDAQTAETISVVSKTVLLGASVGVILVMIRNAPPLEDHDRKAATLALVGLGSTVLGAYAVRTYFPNTSVGKWLKENQR